MQLLLFFNYSIYIIICEVLYTSFTSCAYSCHNNISLVSVVTGLKDDVGSRSWLMYACGIIPLHGQQRTINIFNVITRFIYFSISSGNIRSFFRYFFIVLSLIYFKLCSKSLIKIRRLFTNNYYVPKSSP